jgi:class 3 adenylate cyclase
MGSDQVDVDAAAILVVDDNDDNLFMLTRRLRRLGYDNLTTACDGQMALDQLGQQRFDLVLLDIMMPRLNGYQVLEQMKADPELRNLPVIMISAIDDLESVVRCISAGAEDYLPKPFDPVLLKARIGACLEKKHLRDEVVQQLEFIRDLLGKYVPRSIAEAIVQGKGKLQPTKTLATVLYSDIEAFTSVVERLPPERVVDMLNEYFPAVIAPISKHGGIVTQFQGDAMLVTFNMPLPDPHHADKALQAATEIQELLRDREFAGVALPTRIGINSGEVVAGNVGSGDRFNYTVHGDAVNIAARLEQLNKELGTRVLISASTVAQLSDSGRVQSIGETRIRGKSAPMEIYTLAQSHVP